MNKNHNKKKLLLIVIIVPILVYLSWLFYLKINTETIFDIINEVVENKVIEKIEVSSIYSLDVKFSIEDKADINKILEIYHLISIIYQLKVDELDNSV